MALILDTGPLVAYLDRSDPDHDGCRDLIDGTAERRVIPALALVEVEYLVRPWRGVFAALMANVRAGRFEVHLPTPTELERAGALVETYHDLPLGLVDASVLAATEHFGETRLATLDRRHFTVVRPAHTDHLTLLPL